MAKSTKKKTKEFNEWRKKNAVGNNGLVTFSAAKQETSKKAASTQSQGKTTAEKL